MLKSDLNGVLRGLVVKLIDAGWIKTSIGKILLGTNGQAHLNHWMKENGGVVHDFDLKPLTKIGALLDYDIHIVYVPKGETEFCQELENRNLNFVKELEVAIINYLSNKIETPKITRSSRGKLDQALDELLNS